MVDRKQYNRRGWEYGTSFQSTPLKEQLLPTRLRLPQVYHLPIVYSNFDSISGL
jgi:hypothetical protein